MRISIVNWDEFQHYRNRRPPWIKLHRQLLDNRHWFALSGDASKLLAELWLIASDSDDGTIDDDPADLAFRLHRQTSDLSSCLQELTAHDFIDMCQEYASAVLASCLPRVERETETERETEQRESSVLSEPEPSSDGKETEGDFCNLVRKHLWQSKQPPGSGNMGNEISIRRALINQGEDPEVVDGVVAQYQGDPVTMRIYWAKEARQQWTVGKARYLNSLPVKVPKLSASKVGDVLGQMQKGAA